MVKDYDKPQYIEVKRNNTDNNKTDDKSIRLIKEMIKTQSFGVLATRSDKECYTSLISFTGSDDFTKIVFATPIQSKKFELIEKNKGVSILIDNRSNNEKSINDIAAITSLGQAKILKEKSEIEKWSQILIDKHAYLKDFIEAETSSLILVEISDYYYVTSFQQVIEWSPK